jgi:hypothetical protein
MTMRIILKNFKEKVGQHNLVSAAVLKTVEVVKSDF